MKYIRTLLVLVLFSAPVLSQAKPKMIYFGGYLANRTDMATWERGCAAAYGGQYDFEGNAYRGANSSENAALAGARERMNHYVNEITANPAQEYVIVGHSSAASIPANIARRLPASAKVKLVLLDGFSSGAAMQDKFPTVCYAAMNPVTGCRNRTQFSAPSCNTRMCRHFRILNRGAPANATISTGYANFSCNIDWMGKFPE